jgi:hypothetical protein
MFRREHHQRIGVVLEHLNPEVLQGWGCLFGGGTVIALRYGEYRESVDLDFLVSDLQGYRELRQMIRRDNNLRALWKPGAQPIPEEREPFTDQYGIRSRLNVAGVSMKLEIVLEGRISLDPPGPVDKVCGINCLALGDMACCKLLANSDRWNDDSVFSRDVLDLAHLPLTKALLAAAISKAEMAYGESIRGDLDKALHKVRVQDGWLDRCREALAIESPRAVLWQKLKSLKQLAAMV